LGDFLRGRTCDDSRIVRMINDIYHLSTPGKGTPGRFISSRSSYLRLECIERQVFGQAARFGRFRLEGGGRHPRTPFIGYHGQPRSQAGRGRSLTTSCC
jgi:hypothetical protein